MQRQITPSFDASLGYHLERDHLGHGASGLGIIQIEIPFSPVECCYALPGSIWYNQAPN